MKKHIPISLVIIRLLIGIVIAFISVFMGGGFKSTLVILVIIGFVADIFDGIIARYIGVSTPGLRVWDTNVDRIFWLLVLMSCYYLHKEYIISKIALISSVLSFELLIYLVSIFRFGKTPSPHNLLTKLWGIMIAVSLTEILFTGTSSTFNVMMVIGFISRTDTLLIYCILKKWDHDIPSFFHALQLNKGRTIKKFKLFNG
jgi:CDP-diacylglycerol---glycerol-3-phosphate 3-phosphatidyltransferase